MTIPDIENLQLPLETTIRQILIPAFTGCVAYSDKEHELLGLSMRLDGMGLVNPATSSPHTFSASEQLTFPLVALIVAQDTDMAINVGEAQNIEKSIHQSNRQRQEEAANTIYDTLSPQLQCCVDLANEKAASDHPLPLSHPYNQEVVKVFFDD